MTGPDDTTNAELLRLLLRINGKLDAVGIRLDTADRTTDALYRRIYDLENRVERLERNAR